VNSDFGNHEKGTKIDANARGHARTHWADKRTEVSGVDPNARHDVPSMYAVLTGRNGEKLGNWLFSAHLENQFITIGNQQYQVALRYKQKERPFAFHLTDFKHE